MQTSRRALIAALPAVAVVAAAPAAALDMPADRSAWGAAMRAYRHALAEDAAFEVNVWEPVADSSKIPAVIAERFEQLGERICDTAETLMQTPAPDLAALRWKLDHLTDNGERWDNWSPDYVMQALADIARLLPAGG